MLVLLTGLNLNAQKFSFGPEVGTNLVMIEKSDLGRNYNLCWLAGGSGEIYFNDYLSLRSGVYFSHRKMMYQTADTTELTLLGFDLSSLGIPGVDFSIYQQTKGVISLFGLEVPVLATLNINEFSFFAGPYANFLVGAWSKERTDTQIPFLQTFNIDSLDPTGFIAPLFPPATSTRFSESSSVSNMRVFDMGFKTGFGYTGKLFRVNCYYTFGIPDYRIDRGNDQVRSHHYASITLGYQFKPRRASQSSFGN